MRKIILAAAALATLGTADVARAGGLSHTHDGFYLQMDAGLGALSSKSSTFFDPFFGDVDLAFSGTAGQFSLALGGALTPNFVLAGRFWGVTVTSPEVKLSGQKVNATDITQGLSGVGLDLTYYFMPVNIYLTATPSIGLLSLEQGGETYKTKNGFALRLAAGKEWWVSDNWGIGLNVQYAFASNKDEGTDAPTWTSNWFGVAFCATYN